MVDPFLNETFINTTNFVESTVNKLENITPGSMDYVVANHSVIIADPKVYEGIEFEYYISVIGPIDQNLERIIRIYEETGFTRFGLCYR